MIKGVGLATALALILANTVGAGILTTSGYLARDIGDQGFIMGLWAVGGVLALCGAYCYAQLAKTWPQSGGEYVYLSACYGKGLGFLSGWTSLTLGFGAALAASALGLAGYLVSWLDWPSNAVTVKAIALIALLSLSLLHGQSLQLSSRTQLLLTGLKLLLLLSIFSWAAWSLPQVAQNPVVSRNVAVGSLGTGLIYVMYAYSGWNAINYIASEVEGGAVTLRKALLLACVLIGILYLALNQFYFAALPMAELAAEPVLPVAKKALAAALGAQFSQWFALAVVLSIASAMSAMIWLGPKVYQQMARDGVAPSLLQQTNAAKVPRYAVVLQSGWAGLLVLTGSFDQLLLYSGGPLLVFSMLAVSCVWRQPEAPTIIVTLAASCFISVSGAALLLLLATQPYTLLGAAVTVLAGLPLYFLLQKYRADFKPTKLTS